MSQQIDAPGDVGRPDVGTLGRVLLVDDDALVLRTYGRVLRDGGFAVVPLADGNRAGELVADVDAVVSDVCLAGTSGLDVLRAVKERAPDVPVLLMSGGPVDAAIEAVGLGASRYLVKPVARSVLTDAVRDAVRAGASARRRRAAVLAVAAAESRRLALATRFERALPTLAPHFHPIVDARSGEVHAWEALARTAEGELAPADLFDAADELHRWHDLGRLMRARIAARLSVARSVQVFVNVHPAELDDEDLFDPAAPLSRHADRVVLELTERASLGDVADTAGRLRRLRALGYRVAVDDLGAGHAGLSTFVEVRPDVVKLDMSLVRGVDHDPSRRAVVRSVVGLARDLGLRVVGEGVETRAEGEALLAAGCDLLQGFLFGHPAAELVVPDTRLVWPDGAPVSSGR